MPEYIRPKEHVLVIEDDRIAQRFLEKHLSEIGDVLLANTGREGLKLFREMLHDDPFSVICLDLDLPDISGNEVLTAVRELEDQLDLPKEERAVVLITTAESGMKNVLLALSLGCDGYISKPFTREQLFNELNKLGVQFSWS